MVTALICCRLALHCPPSLRTPLPRVPRPTLHICATSGLALGPLAEGNNQCYIYLWRKGKSLIIIQRYQITSNCAVACTQCGIKLHIRVSDYIGHCTTKRLSEDINPMTQHTWLPASIVYCTLIIWLVIETQLVNYALNQHNCNYCLIGWLHQLKLTEDINTMRQHAWLSASTVYCW